MTKTRLWMVISCFLLICLMLPNFALADQGKVVSDVGFYCGNLIVLYSDGTIDVEDGSNNTFNMRRWTDVSSLKVCDGGVLGIKNDGSVYAWGLSLRYDFGDEWTDIVLGAAGSTHAVGLKSDGTWVSAGDYRNGECDVEDWTDIIDIEVGKNYTVGLRSDGTVVATGKNNKGQCNVEEWTDIVKIAVGSGINFHTVGLRSDGTVVATGEDNNDQCLVGRWKDVKDIAADWGVTIGLTNDGKILITENDHDAITGYGKNRSIPAKFEHATRLVADCLNIAIINDDGSVEVYGNNLSGACDYFSNPETNDQGGEGDKTYSKSECEDIAIKYMTEHVSKYLKNPNSLQINETTSYKVENNQYLFDIDFSSMNSFGGYDREHYYCYVDYTTGKVVNGGMI